MQRLKKRMFGKLVIILTYLALSVGLMAKEDAKKVQVDTNLLKPKYGLNFSYDVISNFADFRKFKDVNNCCMGFTNTTGLGYSIGGTYDLPRTYKYGYQLLLDFNYANTFFTSNENIDVIIDGRATPGVFQHQLFSELYSINVNPNIYYKPLDKYALNLNAGISLSVLANSYFSQKEIILQPSDRGEYKEGGRERNYFTGDIPNATSLNIGLNFGAFYEFKMNRKGNLFLVPNFRFQYNLLNNSDSAWNHAAFRFGIGVKYRTPPPPPPPPIPPMLPPMPKVLPLPKEPSTITANIDVIEVDTNGIQKDKPQIKVEDFVSLNMRPLLNYIFFEENSEKIPKRYKLLSKNETENFNFKDLQSYDAIQTYYHVLNIIGKRFQDESGSKLKLIGCNANIRDEKGNKQLSKSRAEEVKDYLVNTWNVPEESISIEVRNLPQQESKSDTLPSQQENMRVEIESNNDNIIRPVITIDTFRVITKTKFRFSPKVDTEFGLKNYKFTIKQGSKILFENKGNSDLPSQFNWELNQNAISSNLKIPITYSFEATDNAGNFTSTNQKQIPIEQLTVDKKRIDKKEDKAFEYYSLILFDYGKSNLGKEHKEVVDFVKERINENAKISIFGYTDAKGLDKINERISTERAKAVAKRLDIDGANVEGKGESELLYDNYYPEGRFYCRTVRILVETNIKSD